jgi:hypothetical protein
LPDITNAFIPGSVPPPWRCHAGDSLVIPNYAKEAEAERERRAKIVAAEGEYQAAVKLGEVADIITQYPVALQLRPLQTMAEISTEKNSTIIFPAQFMTTVQEADAVLSKDSASK